VSEAGGKEALVEKLWKKLISMTRREVNFHFQVSPMVCKEMIAINVRKSHRAGHAPADPTVILATIEAIHEWLTQIPEMSCNLNSVLTLDS
jgi:hypothetical protein